MKKGTKRVIALLLIAIMVIPYAGCGKKGESVTFNKNAIYKEEPIKLDLPADQQVNEVSGLGNKLFISTYTYDEKTYDSQSFMYTANQDGTGITPFKLADDKGQYYVSSRAAYGDDKFLFQMYEDKSDYSDMENPIYDGEYSVYPAIDPMLLLSPIPTIMLSFIVRFSIFAPSIIAHNPTYRRSRQQVSPRRVLPLPFKTPLNLLKGSQP